MCIFKRNYIYIFAFVALTTRVVGISLIHFGYVDCIFNQNTHQAHSMLILYVQVYNLAILVKWNHFISLDCLYGVKRFRTLIYVT